MPHPAPRPDSLADQVIVTADQMRAIEARLFADGMPVAALMEKVAGRIAAWIMARFPLTTHRHVGILAGPGHNGGDALVVARELHHRGYTLHLCVPLPRQKELTACHHRYLHSLGVPSSTDLFSLASCDLVIDGLFGFGLERALTGPLVELVAQLNRSGLPTVSIDLPSGLHTDTGAVLGQAVAATHTLCLGLWKRAFVQEAALPWLGQPHRLGFDIPPAAIQAVLGEPPSVQRLTPAIALARFPLPRSPVAHKYRLGHLLLIAGSRQYGGAAMLAGWGAQASGVGLVTMAVPDSLRELVLAQHSDALVVGCPETAAGTIRTLPPALDLSRYDGIACGPGLGGASQADGAAVLSALLACDRPLVLDADGLNHLGPGATAALAQRPAPTGLTPHPGEFRRLFPALAADTTLDAGQKAQRAAQQSGAVVVLKGARTAIASPEGGLWFVPNSTPALARGGSGDVLTGVMGGLLAQRVAAADRAGAVPAVLLDAALAAAWWHATAAVALAEQRTVLGVDPTTLARSLPMVLANQLALGQD